MMMMNFNVFVVVFELFRARVDLVGRLAQLAR